MERRKKPLHLKLKGTNLYDDEARQLHEKIRQQISDYVKTLESWQGHDKRFLLVEAFHWALD